MSNQKTEVYEISDDAALDLEGLFEDPKSKIELKGGPGVVASRRAGKAVRAEEGARLPSTKSAPLAASFSLFLCGAGQLYNGQFKMGALFLLLEAFTFVAHWAMVRMWPIVMELAGVFEVAETTILLSVACADLLFAFFVVGQVVQAYHHAETWGRGHDGIRFPLLSGLASAVLPGWGQLFNAQIGKAAIFLSLALTSGCVGGILIYAPDVRDLIFTTLSGAFSLPAATLWMGMGFAAAVIWVMSIYDAYLVARYRR